MGLEILEKLSHIPEYFRMDDQFDRCEINIARAIGKTKKKKYIVLTDQKTNFSEIETPQTTRFEPIIPYCGNVERFLAMISGPSGKGKTVMLSEWADQYHKLYPDHKIWYVCGTDISKDENLSKQKYIKQLDPEMFKDMDSNDLMNHLEDSLVLIDDCDVSGHKKEITKAQNEIIEKGRKFHISLATASHLNTSGEATKFMVRECDLYVCFQGGLRNNRFLSIYKNLRKDYLESLEPYSKSWYCFNWKYNILITPHVIKFLE